METITGIHDVTQGRKPGGIEAASAISLLQEAGQARIRDKSRNLERALVELGRKLVSRITQFYGSDRVVRIKGNTPGTFEFVAFDPSQIVYGLDVRAEAGTSLQINEQLRYQMAVELFRLGAIDVEGILEAINWPGREAVIERLRAQQAMMAQPVPGGPEKPPGGDLLALPQNNPMTP